ncbi:ATP-binding cassette domain-containing protein [Herbiconiux sp. L3-i23]|uniref:branched-chain amino acid ABC transporter ATP-binding protein/permease n=1 Tax=Herbiconiux sp. L3-i23 TaxID=2905871 RepID=UPI002046DF42|nr:ATP-binding cassette domain-containing protein [Herbiconiux sp. L3-i23]BDI22526.1 hypothetical protein L3i23_13020 [Herbiconiux sp. L3-i23]
MFAGAVFLAVVALLSAFLPFYWVYLLSTVGVGALVARSIGLLTGQVGIITLCQLSFAAIGGWVVSWLALQWPSAPFPVLVLLGGLATFPIGTVIGVVTARIRGVELAVVTLGFATALDLVLRQTSFPGVGQGVPVLPTAPFDDARWFTVFAVAVLIVTQLGVAALARSRHGVSWQAVRGGERAAASLGVPVLASKATAFGTSALIAGLAGGLLAGQYGLLTTSVFSPLASLVSLATAVLCGAALFSGAVLAGAFGVLIPEVLRRLDLPLDLGNALLAIGAFDTLRRGNGGLMEQFTRWREERSFRDVRVTCEIAETARSGAGPDLAGAEAGAGAAERRPRLSVRGLTVDFGGNRALDGVDLDLAVGEVQALIGPNGAGKSTLVDAVTGFLARHQGSVMFDGTSVDALSARRRAKLGIRRTFQQSRAVEALTVAEYLCLAAEGMPVDVVHTFFGLPDGDVPIRLMDIGSRRILEVAAALASRPGVLLLDEPAAGLGEEEHHAFAELVRRIPDTFGTSVLLIEHDMGFIRVAARRATVLDEGRVISSGPVAEVLRDPRVVAAYLGTEAAA